MGVIQGSLNQLAGTSLGAAALGTHAVNTYQEKKSKEMSEAKQEQEEKDIDMLRVENKMSEATLKAEGYEQADINALNASNMFGLKPTAEYKPKYDAMKALIAKQVLLSETYAKAEQNKAFRKILAGFEQDKLDAAVGFDPKGGKK